MDPLSIATSSISLVAFCGQVVKILSQFIDQANRVDDTVKMFFDEISALSRVLNSVSSSFTDPALSSRIALTGHEGQHWGDVLTSMGDCRRTLERLVKILEKVSSEEKGALRRTRKQFRLNIASGEIAVLRNQILLFTQTLQISLQMINL
jgi:hypothetical protein